jgi:glycosyltransferase involved in cell wall biosynthesis
MSNLFEWSTARRLARLIVRERVDLVHANNDLLSNRVAIVAARMARVPVVSHERGWPADTMMSRMLRKMVDARVAISDSIAVAIGKTGLSAPVRRVYDGIDVDAYERAGAYREAARQSLGFDDEIVIGFPSVMTAWKGHRCFLESLAGIRRRFPNVRGLVLGGSPGRDDSYERSVKRAVGELGLGDVVRFTGHVESMMPMYAAMDVMVHASQQAEPFGLVVVEAMAAGVPVIASKHGGPAEVISHGVNGLLHDPAKPELGRLITTLIDRPHFARQLVEAGRRRARFFDHTRTWRGVVGLYREIHARRHTTLLSADGNAPLLAGGASWP